MHRSMNIDENFLGGYCEANHIRRLSLFGSQLKGTARPDSDIDLLVEFESEARITLLDMAQIEIELSQALGGRKVDLNQLVFRKMLVGLQHLAEALFGVCDDIGSKHPIPT